MKWFYKNREERSKWLVQRFEKEIKEAKKLLDVGCYNADIKEHLPDGIKYTGIDIAGKPNHFVDLETVNRLPFDNEQFETVVCADVLEHLENIHLIFDEICRVAKKYVIITLPNAYATLPFFVKGNKYATDLEKRKQFGKHMKFYGLPYEKPADRHKWFFSFSEANDFVKYNGEKNGFEIVLTDSDWNYSKLSLEKLYFSFFKMINKDFTQKHFICLLKRKSS